MAPPAARRPGSATAFEALVDDYDAARPDYPDALYDALGPLDGVRVLELGAGTGIATAGLLARGAQVVATDRGPNMLGRLHRKHPQVPVAVARAEALPVRDAAVDLVCGAQMWHWVQVPEAAGEAARVLRPGGRLALWWNEVDAAGEPWYEAQQARLEAAGTGYRRAFRVREYGAELEATGRFDRVERWTGGWTRRVELPLYERRLRSTSYVSELPDQAGFLAAERASLLEAFPDGVVVEPYRVVLWTARAVAAAPGPRRD